MDTNQICPACALTESRFCARKNGFEVFRCRNCQTLFTIGEDISEQFNYDGYYDESNLSVPQFIERRLDEIIGEFDSYRQSNRLLDVGCGQGTLMAAARRGGWQVEGVEVSRSAVEFLRKKGFQVYHGKLTAAFPAHSFDVVTASELLEHVSEPLELLDEIVRILRPGGLFWATTPHGRGVSAKLLGAQWTVVSPPEHLHLFSVKGMKFLLEKAGFSSVKIRTYGTNPFEIGAALLGKISAREDANLAERPGFMRTEKSHELNEALSASKSRQAVKNLLNGALNATSLGDGLKVWAVK